MNSSKYPFYAMAIVVGGALALWAGLSPFILLFFVACPLLMFFMMRGGMHGDAHSEHGGSDSTQGANHGAHPSPPSDLDGSHDRI